MNRVRLSVRSVRHTLADYARLSLGIAFVAFLIVGANSIQHSIRGAILTDIRLRAFGHDTVVSPRSGGDEFLQFLRASPSVLKVSYLTASVARASLRLPRVEIAQLDRGVEVSRQYFKGRPPVVDAEIALSSGLADALNVKVGQIVEVNSVSKTVTGVFPTPADKRALRAIAVMKEPGLTTWFADRSDLARYASKPGERIEFRSIDTHFSNDPFRSNAKRVASVLDSFSLLLVAAGALGVGGSIVVFGRSRRDDIEALEAAGLSLSEARKVFVLAGSAVLIAGAMAGAVFAFLILHLFSHRIASVVSQQWVSVSFSWLRLAGHGASVALAGSVGWRSTRWSRADSRLQRGVVRPGPGLVCAAAAVILTIWAAARPHSIGKFELLRGVAALTMASAGVVSLAGTALGQTRGPGVRRLYRLAAPSSSALSYIASLCLLGSIVVGGAIFNDFHSLNRSGVVPTSSLVLETVRDVDAELIVEKYKESTGKVALDLHYLAETPTSMVRLSQGSAFSCWSKQSNMRDANCLNSAALRTAAGDVSTGRAEIWAISPDLVDGSGQVTVIRFNPETGSILDVSRSDAHVDGERLGLYGIGGIAPSGFAQTVADTSSVLLQGFGELPLSKQAEVQGLIFQHAGYSQVGIDRVENLGLLTLAWATAGMGAILASLMLVRWSDGVWRKEPSIQDLIEMLPGSRQAKKFLVRLYAIPLALIAATTILVAPPLALALFRIPVGSFAPIVVVDLLVLAVTMPICVGLLLRSLGTPKYRDRQSSEQLRTSAGNATTIPPSELGT
jgi:hypothetical protein